MSRERIVLVEDDADLSATLGLALEREGYEIVSYPADKFASEIMEILETTDVGVIQSELRQVIGSQPDIC